MAGIRDALHLPPPAAASPGLPPVDPVVMPADRPSQGDPTVMGPEDADADRDAPPDDDPRAKMPDADQSCGSGELKKAVQLRSVDASWASSDALSRDLHAALNPLATPEPDAVDETPSPIEARDFAGFRGTPKNDGRNAFLPAPTIPCAGLSGHVLKDRGAGPCGDDLGDLDALLDQAMDHLSLAFDTRPGIAADHGDKPTPPRRRIPPRIEARPKRGDWDDDALMTLIEAAALFWPDGPITVNTLRTAARDHTLEITKIAGKIFTTPSALRRMSVAVPNEAAGAPVTEPVVASAEAMFEMRLAEAKRLGVGRARRSRRAAKRPVAPTVSGRAGQ